MVAALARVAQRPDEGIRGRDRVIRDVLPVEGHPRHVLVRGPEGVGRGLGLLDEVGAQRTERAQRDVLRGRELPKRGRAEGEDVRCGRHSALLDALVDHLLRARKPRPESPKVRIGVVPSAAVVSVDQALLAMPCSRRQSSARDGCASDSSIASYLRSVLALVELAVVLGVAVRHDLHFDFRRGER